MTRAERVSGLRIGLTKTTLENHEAQAKLLQEPVVQRQAEAKTMGVRAAGRLQGEGELFTFNPQSDAPSCDNCGMIMVRNGSCYKCLNCGNTSGCG